MPRISLIRLISITIVLSIAINEKRFVEAFLEGFAASISKMNEQLTKFMEGIQKNVDLWSDTVIEHAKDEECLFVCPKGQQAFPKENSSSTATNQTRGCITFGIKIKDDDLPSKTMRECCNQQQICYHQCNVAKTKCENEFQECLRKKCHDISQDQKQFMVCDTATKLLFMGILSFGCKTFKDAQRESCYCPEIESNKEL